MNWATNDPLFKRILARNNDPDNEELSVANTKKELLEHLKNTHCWQGLSIKTIQALKQAQTFHSLNRVLDELYDFADSERIWTGFMPTKEEALK